MTFTNHDVDVCSYKRKTIAHTDGLISSDSNNLPMAKVTMERQLKF